MFRPLFPSSATEFWDTIPDNVTTTENIAFAANAPHLAFHSCAEMGHPYFDTNGFGVPPRPLEWQQLMRRAYYACISYVDSLFGEVLDLIDHLGLTNDTVVSVLGDHGWQVSGSCLHACARCCFVLHLCVGFPGLAVC